MNEYAFTRDNPVMFSDPSGLAPEDDDDDSNDPLRVTDDGRQHYYDGFRNAINKGAKAGLVGLDIAASLNPIANACTAATGKNVSNKDVGGWGRFWAALGVIPGAGAAHGAEEAAGEGLVKEFEIGTYKAMKDWGVEKGLELHHFPQAHVAEQTIAGYSRDEGVVIALKIRTHRTLAASSRMKGKLSHLKMSAVRNIFEQQGRDLLHKGVTPEKLEELKNLVKLKHPDLFDK